jgi:hypothetical protein
VIAEGTSSFRDARQGTHAAIATLMPMLGDPPTGHLVPLRISPSGLGERWG